MGFQFKIRAGMSLILASLGFIPCSALAGEAPHAEEDGGNYCRGHWFDVGVCRDSLREYPRVVVGVELGVAKMNESGPFGFHTGVGTVTDAGPAWGLRGGVELFSWLAFEARYAGDREAIQASVAPTGSLGFLASAAEMTLRLTAPLPWVHPYIFGGIGYEHVAVVGSSATRAGSPLFSSGQPDFPLGFGFDVPLTWRLSVAFEATYHFQLGEDYSNDTTNGIDGGDISTFNAVLRGRF
jgi:hypothetical protein